ncbi:MAG: aspartate dehydrogenase [Eubacterium sp.]|nr:aspartate dehydrogenase [Eubacterium sp.]
MLFQKKKIEKQEYDRENEKPVLKCSICNGEQVAGFKNIHSGKIREVMYVRNDAELKRFMDIYGITEITKEY